MANAVIGALRVNLGIDSAQFQNGLKQAQGGLSKFASYARTGMMAAAAAGTAAAAAFGVAVRNTVNAADDMSKAASKIGIPTEELSRLKYAADLSGVSFEGLQGAVGRLSRVMNDAKNGSTEAVDTFNQLGISATNADGSLKSASQVLTEVSSKFASMPDGAEKTALAMELMGRSGANMIPLLNGGAEAMSSLMAEADSFGQVFSEQMGKDAEAFNDNISRLTGLMGNLAAKVATEILPHLVQLTDWLVANKDSFTTWSQAIVGAFVRLGQDFMTLKAEIEAVATFINNAWDATVAKTNEVLAAMQQFAAGIVAAFAAIPEQMAQIGADIINGLWNGIQNKWGEVKGKVTGLAAGIKDSFTSFFQIRSPSRVMMEVGQYVMEGLGQGMESMSGGVTDIASSIASTVSNAFMGLIDGSKKVKDVLKDLLSQVSSMLLNQGIKTLLGGLGGGGLGGIGSFIGKLFGFKANGGPVRANKPYIVGERGPELMVPGSSGSVVSNAELAKGERGGQAIVITGTFVDDNGVIKAQVTQMGQQAAQAGAAVAVGQVRQNFSGMLANTQTRQM